MKSCIIVGAGPGVSASIARRFGSEGYAIGLIARDGARLRDEARQLSAGGIVVEFATADAGDMKALDGALASLLERLGRCDVLVYNAAVLRSCGPLALTTADIEREFAVNLLGAHRAASRIAPAMIERGSGAILMTGGGLALEPYPEWTSLALGKAALRSLSLSLYKELKPRGVHVCVLAICGIVEKGGPFDPDAIAAEYWRVATQPRGLEDREVVYRPPGSDPAYNDPGLKHAATTILPAESSRREA